MVALMLVGLCAADEVAERLVAVGLTEQAYARLLEQAQAAPTPEEAAALELAAGAALWSGGAYGLAARHFQLSTTAADRELALAWSLYADGNPRGALHALEGTADPRGAWLAGWGALSLHEPAEALSRWRDVPAGDPLYPSAQAMITAVSGWDRVPYRSPALAGTLSAILPGAGQAYTGMWGEAASALLVNGALIAAGWQLARRDLWFGFSLVAALEFGFYGGNIVSAAGRARRFNRLAWQEPIEALARQHGPSATVSDGALLLETP
jgi:hypothetical protein